MLFGSAPPPVQQAEENRNKEQRGGSGKNQPADYGSAEWRVLFSTFPQADRHRHHADDHRQGGHQDRPEAGESRCQRGGYRVLALFHLFLGEADHQNAVGGSHPHTHDGTGQGRNADIGVGDEKEPHDSRQGSRQGCDDDERIKPRLKVHHDQQVHQQDGERQAGDQSGVGR